MNENQDYMSSEDLSTQEKILTAATEEFAASGASGARVDRIARKAGVNKAMIYYYFRSKDGLYRAVISTYLDRASKMITGAIDQSLEIEDFLLSISDTYARIFHLAGPFRSILLRELAGGDPAVIHRIAETLSETGLAKKISFCLQRGIQEGRLRAVDIRQAVFSFIAMNVGFMLLAPLAGRILDVSDTDLFVQERKRAVVDLFLNGVKARQE